MADSDEISSRRNSKGMENLSLQPNRIPRDLLRRFIDGSSSSSRRSEFLMVKEEEEEDEESDEVELSLGLSLGGRFGVDKSSGTLIRSSSIAGPIPIVRDDDTLTATALVATVQPYASLVRTSSLPVETEDEWRKRKELQSLRRMAAKRRRSEKQRVLKTEKEGERQLRGKGEREQYVAAMKRVGSSAAPAFGGLPAWAAGGSGSGSVDSQAGSCSSVSELENKPFQGSSSCGDRRAKIESLKERSNLERGGSNASVRMSGAEQKDTTPSPKKTDNAKELGVNSLENMPCVFTKGDGPNGRTIEGILYRYGKGEEVRIMCVCHGAFHSPAEFVKHAGGTDVAQPLKHIVVNPNSSSF